MNPNKIRVRYAPSPTGIPHVGNIRTALFNWLFARHNGGVFIVRIEDTDQARQASGATEAILSSLRWLGLDWDEGPTQDGLGSQGDFGPYFQSERRKVYVEASALLLQDGNAYQCYCTPDRLDEMRKSQQRRKEPPRYDRQCRDLSPKELKVLDAANTPSVVRFATPRRGTTTFTDLIRGEIAFENSTLDDFVLLKSDGFPTYHLANVVDDHMMEISHVLRADEWVSSTPRHVMLYEAFDWHQPLWAHLPMILGPDRSKLSKRHGATSLLDYRDEGFLPEALVNFLALLGWSYDDKTEFFTCDELVECFNLERIGKTGAIFNREKLEWMDGVYIRGMAVETLADRMLPFLERDLPSSIARPISSDHLLQIVPLVQDRLKNLAESSSLTDFFFSDLINHEPDSLVQKSMTVESTRIALELVHTTLQATTSFSAENLESILRPMAEHLGLKTGQLFSTIRVATTGRTIAPPLFATMETLGKNSCLQRIAGALEVLKG